MYGDGWSVYGFYAFGEKIKPALENCPKTATVLSKIPGLTMAGFSRLSPQAHIKPHVGWVKTVYRSHLGLSVPDNCGLRVGFEVRNWTEGKCLIFDDTGPPPESIGVNNISDICKIRLMQTFVSSGRNKKCGAQI